MKYKYTYFVSYFYSTAEGINGFGHSEICRKNKIKSFKDIDEIIDLIKMTNQFESIVILNYRRIK